MAKFRAFALLFGAVVCTTAGSTCDASSADDCHGDLFAGLQISQHRALNAGPGKEETAPTGQPKWRDVIEYEKELHEKVAALQARGEEAADPWHHWLPPWQRHVFVANAQQNPQKPVPEAFQHSPYSFYKGPSDALTTPKEVRSENGLLETTLVVDAAWLEVPHTGFRVRTRLYNGSYPGPTIRVKRGDRLRIKVINNLGPDRPLSTRWQRREAQATNEFPEGLPEDHPRYQDVGQERGHPDRMYGKVNNMHDVNVTNLHTHGFHVSPHTPQDNVIDTKIGPAGEFQYIYELSPYHSSGNSWYHDHWHGAVTGHTNGGMIGAIIVDDSPGEAPEWITNAPEVLAIIHETDWSYFGPQYLKFFPNDNEEGCFPFGSTFSVQCALGHRTGIMANLSGDNLYRMEYKEGFGYGEGEHNPVSAFFSVNGQLRPTYEMRTGEWARLRLIFGSGNFPINPIFNSTSPCEMWLVAKDSAWIDRYPRRLEKGAWLGAGNRAQVMIRCSKAGTFPIYNNASKYNFASVSLDPQQTFLFIKVVGPDSAMPEPTQVDAQRPRYLKSLVDVPYSDIETPEVPLARNIYNNKLLTTPVPILEAKTMGSWMNYDFPGGSPGLTPIFPAAFQRQPVRFTINNMTFSHEKPQATFPVGKILELKADGLETHSWHMHTNPVQFFRFGDPDYHNKWGGYFEIGDWADVLQLPNPVYDVRSAGATATVRWQTDCYQGVQIVHCHVLYHEDLGMMTWFNATGPDHTTNPMFNNSGIFAHPPEQCTRNGQQCAPNYCAPEYTYGRSG